MVIDVRSRLGVSPEELASFCRRWKIQELAAFGSVLREDFWLQSDIDLLVTFEDGAGWSLLDHVRMQYEMSELLGRDANIVTRPAVGEAGIPTGARRYWRRRGFYMRYHNVPHPNDLAPGHVPMLALNSVESLLAGW
jgi:predicted nucleotidyltransferase